MNLLANKAAVVTGGTRGLGLAIAKGLAAEGAAVLVASRSAAGVEAAVQALRQAGYRAEGLAADVGQLEQVESLAESAVRAFGKIDIWVNNAGTAGPYGPTLDFSPEVFTQVLQTNVLGVYHGSRAALRRFVPQGSGKLINLLGHGYKNPVPFQNAYASSKAWIRSFTLALAKETRGSGVGVFAYNPGMVLTELLTDIEVYAGSEERLKRFPGVVKFLSKPPEMPASKVVWLASSATDGKTGLLVSYSSFGSTLTGALKALLTRAPEVEIKIRTIPPDR